MEVTCSNVEMAVRVFYSCEATERAAAHTWLTAAQRCPEAWTFLWELLLPQKGTEVQFFAATTLHTKLLRCWNEVPPENYEALKNKILEAIMAFSNGPKIVLNRLCISLAAYIMQQGAADLASTLRPLSTEDNLHVLLEILTVIPEEFNSMTMGASLRTRTRAALQQAAPAVLDDMRRHLQTVYQDAPLTEAMTQTWCKAASCAASWLGLGGDVTAEGSYREHGTCTANLDDCLPLCDALLRVVHRIYTWNGTVSDSGLEACEAALGAVRAAAAAPDAARLPTSAMQLSRMLTDLSAPILARDNVPNSQNEELLAAIFTCAVAIGESHTRAIVRNIDRRPDTPDTCGDNADTARALVELLLTCQAAPGHYPLHETRSQLTFGFWYMLQDEATWSVESVLSTSETMRGVFVRLLSVLIEKSRAPQESSLASDDAELLRCYRQDIADTVMYCFSVVGATCWDVVEGAWCAADSDASREAALHVFLALADAAPLQRSHPALLRLLEHATHSANLTSEPRLLHTSLECLGAFASWLGSLEGEGGELARAALQATGSTLQRAPARAALALRRLSAECHQHAAPLAAEIVHAAQAASKQYDGWVTRQLLGAAGAALSAAPSDVSTPLLATLADTLYNDLTAEGEAARRLGAKCASRGSCEAAAALLNSLPGHRELATTLLKRLLPALPPLSTHAQYVPPLFQLIKQVITTLLDECLPLVEELSQLSLQAIYTAPCPAGMDVIRLLVLMFGGDWAGCPQLLRASTEACIRACSTTELAASADIAEALFGALTSITKKKPQYLDFLGDCLPQTVELGCACVRLWEAGAARSACGYLSALAASRPKALRSHAPSLAGIAVRCIGGATPRNQVEPLADLLLALNKAQWSDADRAADGDLGHWLRSALEPTDFPSPHASHQHKQKFIAAVLKEKSSRRRLLETVQEFSLVCRGLIGTEYARQALASRQLVA